MDGRMGHVRRRGGESGDDAYDDDCCHDTVHDRVPQIPPKPNFY